MPFLPNPCWTPYNISTFLGTTIQSERKSSAVCSLRCSFMPSCITRNGISYRLLLFLMYFFRFILLLCGAIPCAQFQCVKWKAWHEAAAECVYAVGSIKNACLLEMLHTIHKTKRIYTQQWERKTEKKAARFPFSLYILRLIAILTRRSAMFASIRRRKKKFIRNAR